MLFNLKLKRKNVVKNYEGSDGYVMTPQMELYSAVATAGLSDQFYAKAGEKIQRIKTLIQKMILSFQSGCCGFDSRPCRNVK